MGVLVSVGAGPRSPHHRTGASLTVRPPPKEGSARASRAVGGQGGLFQRRELQSCQTAELATRLRLQSRAPGTAPAAARGPQKLPATSCYLSRLFEGCPRQTWALPRGSVVKNWPAI